MSDSPKPDGKGIIHESNSTHGDGRDSRGRFAAGNPGGPGNPGARTVAAFRAALNEAITPDDLQAIIKKMVECAKGGDMRVAAYLCDRVLGKPIQQSVSITADPESIGDQRSRLKALLAINPHTMDGFLPDGHRIIRAVVNDASLKPDDGE